MNEIKKMFQKIKVDRIVSAIIAIVIGILFVALPEDSSNVLCLVCGIMLIVGGVMSIMGFIAYGFIVGGHLLILGIALLLSGVLCLVNPEVVASILTIIFGIYIIVDGATSMIDSIYCAKAHVSGWFGLLLLSLLTIVLGTIVMFGKFDTVMIFAGCCLIIDGVSDIVSTLVFSHKVKEAKKKLLDDINTIEM